MRKPYIPRAYQEPVTSHILDHDRCMVWVDMGLGKTVATLTAVDLAILAGETQPTLVLGPKRVAKNVWPREAQKWEHLRSISVMPITGSEAERRFALKMGAPIYSCNYENLPWLVDHFGERWPFRRVISDESTRLKGFRLKQGGARTRALATIAHTRIKQFVELTGTPAPNGLIDLWGQAWFIDRGRRLGYTFQAYKERWFQRGFDGYNILPLPFAQEQIQDALRDITISIIAEDYFDLAEPVVNNVFIDLPIKARSKYRDMERDMFAEIDDRTVEAFNAAARTQKCLQFANGAAYVDPIADSDTHPRAREWRMVHDEKIEALESIVQETSGEPLLVSYEFRSDLARIRAKFPQARILDDSQQTEDDWNAGKIPMLLAHPKSAGHGLNLQDGGHHIVFFGHNWDLELRQQIIERIGPVRQMQSGHDRSVYIHNIIARDTVDEDVIARCDSKRSVQDVLRDAMKRRK